MQKTTKLMVILLISIVVFIITGITTDSIFSDFFTYTKAAISQYGSRGQEVIEIQKRLKSWKYYDGSVDGIYGYKTYQSVRRFQYKNGLKVDGIAGNETLSALGLPVNSVNVSNDVNLLAHLIHGESRGEPYVGQVAVGAVVLNRVNNSNFPNTIAGVIYQRGAFDAVGDGQINLVPSSDSIKAAKDAINGWDPSYGCIYYYNPSTATSKWIWSRPIIVKIGKHNFAK